MAEPENRIERMTNMLVDRIHSQIDSMATAITGNAGEGRPPFSKKLTDQEQLEIYFAMDGEKWQQLVQEQGAKGALEYSDAMQKLAQKKLGARPQVAILQPGDTRDAPGYQAQQQPPGGLMAGQGAPPSAVAPDPNEVQQGLSNILNQVGIPPGTFPGVH